MATSHNDDSRRVPVRGDGAKRVAVAGRRSPGTRQVNLALTPTQEELVRLLVLRLREGGLEFERRVREFVQEAPVPRYMHVDELDRRFGAIERRILDLERRAGGRGDKGAD